MISLDMSKKIGVNRISETSFTLENNILQLEVDLGTYDVIGKTITAVFSPSAVETQPLSVVDTVVTIPIHSNEIKYGANYIQLNFRWDIDKVEQSPIIMLFIEQSLLSSMPSTEEVDIVSYLINETEKAKQGAIDITALVQTKLDNGEFIGEKGDPGDGVDLVARELIINLDANVVHGKEVTTNAQTDGKNTTFGHSSNKIADDISTSVILGGGSTGYNNVIGGDGANVNTITPNTTVAGTGAHVSVVGGYDNSAGSLSSKIISDHSKTEVGGDGHNAIYGGANHIAKSTASFAMIAGGQSNEVSGQGTFATGLRNKVAGTGSACFGYDNVLTANGDFANGAANTVSGLYAQASGSTNTATGNFSKAEGNFAHSRTVSQQTFTGGRFAALGDAQTSDIEMHRVTTDATTVTLGVINSNTSHQLLVNQSVAFKSLIVARVVGGTDTSAWEIKGVYRRGATGTPVAVGTPTITNLGADTGASAWTVAMSADSVGGLNVRITGEAGKTIRWVQRMTLVEVIA